MATNRWISGAPAIAQVQNYTFAGTWEADDVIRCTIGGVSKDITATSTTAATIVDAVVTAWNLLSSEHYAAFAEITATRSGDDLILTADTPGKPFVVTLTPLEANLSAADAQTIEGSGTATTGTTTTASSGPNDWSTAANWSLGTVPVDTNDVILDVAENILYGLDQSGIQMASLTILPSFGTALLGLPKHTGSYAEYRTDYLTADITVLTVECDSQRIKINGQAAASTVRVYRTGGGGLEAGLPAMIWKGTEATNTMTVYDGSVGVAVFGGETAAIATLTLTDGLPDVQLGTGLTLTTVVVAAGNLLAQVAITTLTQTGGTVEVRGAGALTTINHRGGILNLLGSGAITTCTKTAGQLLIMQSAIATLLQSDGTTEIRGTGAITTLTVTGGTVTNYSTGTVTTLTQSAGNVLVTGAILTTLTHPGGTIEVRGTAAVGTLTLSGGTVKYCTSGTCTTANIYGGHLDFTGDTRAKTFTTTKVYGDAARITDHPSNVVVWTNGINVYGRQKLDGIKVGATVNIALAAAA